MDSRIIEWLESHRHAGFFKAEMLRNTTYTDIAEYVEGTPRFSLNIFCIFNAKNFFGSNNCIIFVLTKGDNPAKRLKRKR